MTNLDTIFAWPIVLQHTRIEYMVFGHGASGCKQNEQFIDLEQSVCDIYILRFDKLMLEITTEQIWKY